MTGIKTWVGSLGTRVDYDGFLEDRQSHQSLYIHESVPDDTPLTLFHPPRFESRFQTTIGEIRRWLHEKRTQEEAATVAQETAAAEPAVGEELPPADPDAGKVPDPPPGRIENIEQCTVCGGTHYGNVPRDRCPTPNTGSVEPPAVAPPPGVTPVVTPSSYTEADRQRALEQPEDLDE